MHLCGLPFRKKGWRLFDLDTKEFFISRDVKFFEEVFPFVSPDDTNISPSSLLFILILQNFRHTPHHQNMPHPSPHLPHHTNSPAAGSPLPNGSSVSPSSLSTSLADGPAPNGPDLLALSPSHPARPSSPADSLAQPTSPFSISSPSNVGSSSQPTSAPIISDDVAPQPSSSSSVSHTDLGRGHKTKFPSILLRDFVSHAVAPPGSSPHTASLPASSGTPFPIAHYLNCANYYVKYRNFIATIVDTTDPRSFKEDMKDSTWQASMQDKIRALEENGTWTLEELPPGKCALGAQWVYRTKYLSDGLVERLKSRLVVLGNHQEAGVDFTDTFAPVAKMTTVRTFLAIAASKNWELHQMDVHNAFLHGDLDEEVYMKLPPGFQCSNPKLACRLRKSLYGLKQAPRCWFAKLVSALKGYGFLQSYSDYFLFTLTQGSVQINVLVHVDDLIISSNDSAALTIFKSYLSDCFKMKDLGPLKYFLGIEVARNASGLFLCQRKYTLDIISEVGLLGAKPCAFPIEQHHPLAHDDTTPLVDAATYRRLVGRLIYLAVTRPDLSYAVHILSQFMQEPRQAHWDAALRVVRYLKGTPGQGILLRADNDLSLQGWCDSDWAACPITRRSLSGWLVFLGNSHISWKTI